MKIWVYQIDWRSMAIEVLFECKNTAEAERLHGQYLKGLTDEQLVDMTQFKTIGTTAVSAEMQSAAQQFKRVNGRVVA